MIKEVLSMTQKLEKDIWDVMKSRSTYDHNLFAIYTRLGKIREKIQSEFKENED